MSCYHYIKYLKYKRPTLSTTVYWSLSVYVGSLANCSKEAVRVVRESTEKIELFRDNLGSVGLFSRLLCFSFFMKQTLDALFLC